MKISHIALYTNDLEKMKNYYEKYFSAKSNQKYHNSIIEFTFIHDYGPYHEFKKIFSHIWSTYTNSHPTLSLKQLKILLNVQHSFSLNNLFVQK